ncbi:MAG TPA: exodeoxyribonuclease VII large subunit [Planctomycetes bacterium]|nr:exodeoxyribonuclease VII large subunit [Planctomycetota bacterium]
MADKQAKIYTVTEVTSLIKVALAEKMPPRLAVAGEIIDWKHHSSGHCYFSLKDAGGILPCVMWRSKFDKVKFSPADGMAVITTGFVDVYGPQGKYQFYADKLEPAGVGALRLAFEQMAKKLASEGLFDEEHKKALPKYPMRIGIVTSESGAALLDIADSVYNRWPCARMFLYPVPVQGQGAADEIASAIKNLNRRNRQLRLDVLIVGRGGGSPEDLWAFNEEVLARAIFASTIPVISAVGHEIDTTIADLVADARASTPTKAGVIAVPDVREVLAQLAGTVSRFKSLVQSNLKYAQQGLETILASSFFRNPYWLVHNASQSIDHIQMRMTESCKRLFGHLRQRLSTSAELVMRIEPGRIVAEKNVRLNNLVNSARTNIRDILSKRQLHLTVFENKLTVMDPRSVLKRGYSITSNKRTGKIVARLADVEVDEELITELADRNFIESRVTNKHNTKKAD